MMAVKPRKARRNNEPDAQKHNPTPKHVSELIEACKQRHGYTTQSEVAQRIGVSLTTLKDWKRGAPAIPYTAQYTLERLAGIQ